MDQKNNPDMMAVIQEDGVPVATTGYTDEKVSGLEINLDELTPTEIRAEAKEYRKVRHWNMPVMDTGNNNKERLLEEIVARLRTIEEVLLRLEHSLGPAGPASPPAGD